MKKSVVILLVLSILAALTLASCKNEVQAPAEDLVSVSFNDGASRGLSASLEDFESNKNSTYYWAYAAQKADGSKLDSGATANYGLDNETRVWIKTDSNNKPVAGLGSGTGTDYTPYKVPGFSQGYWNFRLYAYKKVVGDNPETTEVETDYVSYALVYQGETKNVLLKSESTNAAGSHTVLVTMNPVSDQGNGKMYIITDKDDSNRITMNTVNTDAVYGTDYYAKVLSILSIEDYPVEYVDAEGAKIHGATSTQNGEYTLPAGSYKVTVAFLNEAETVNYARGTVVATVYSNLDTTIKGDLTEAITYAEFDGILNPDLVTVEVSSEDIPFDESTDPSQTVAFQSTGSARSVTANTTTKVTNALIEELIAVNGTNLEDYDQSLKLTLNVEAETATPTRAVYEISMSATLTSTNTTTSESSTVTSDVPKVAEYVTITIQQSTGLTEVLMLHDGVPMNYGLDSEDIGEVGLYEYDEDTGIITIKTKTFSPFDFSGVAPGEDTYVAIVGTVKYQKLAVAINQAPEQATVQLLRSTTLIQDVDFNVEEGILDLDNYTITLAGGAHLIVSKESEIRNGAIVGSLSVSGNDVVLSGINQTGSVTVSGSDVVLDSCTVSGAIDVSGNISILSGTYIAPALGTILSGNAAVTDGNFKGLLAPINAEGVVLTGGTYEADETAYVASGYECVEVSTGVFKVRKAVEAENRTTGVGYYYLQDAIDEASSGNEIGITRDIDTNVSIVIPEGKSITIDLTDVIDEFEIPRTIRSKAAKVIENNGSLTLKGKGSVLGIAEGNVLFNNGTGASLVITGGTYSADPEAFVSDGLYAHDNGNGTWTVTPIPEGAKVRNGNYFYDLLSEALDASELSDGDNILLLADITDSVAIKNIKNLTIDLNGYTVTADGSKVMLKDKDHRSDSYDVKTTNESKSIYSAFKISECDNVRIKNGTIVSDWHVFIIGDHQHAIVKWQSADKYPLYGYHPKSPAKNIVLENITATATGTDTLFYFTNIEDDLTRANESNYVDNNLYGEFIYKTGYETQEQSEYHKVDEVFDVCKDKDRVTIIDGSYTATKAMFGNMCRFGTQFNVYGGELYTDVVFAESGSFSSDEIGRFLADGKYLVSYADGLYTVEDQMPATYTAKLNDVYYCFAGGANAAIALADFGEKVYIKENADTEKVFGKDDVLTVVYEIEGIAFTGAKPKYDLDGYEVIETIDGSDHEFSVKFFPVAAVYATGQGGSWKTATKVGEYATLKDAFEALKNDYTVVILKDITVGDETTWTYGGTKYKCAFGSATRSTIDFNGYMITYTGTNACFVTSQQSGYLIFRDTSESKTGGITALNGNCVQMKKANTQVLYLYGGIFISGNKPALNLLCKTVFIYGGNYQSSGNSAISNSATTLSVEGGSFKSKTGSKDISSPPDGSIKGGTFSYNWNNIPAKLASGKTCEDNKDGTWTVK